MTIQPISAASAALYFSLTDLQERGFYSDELTDAEILHLTQQALNQTELTLDAPLEIETYSDKHGLLIFVRVTAPLESVWSFDDFETLLTAAHSFSPGDPQGSLYQWNDRYWLVLTRPDPQTNAHLSEFGCSETEDPYIHARLTEYGTLLLHKDTFSTLRKYF